MPARPIDGGTSYRQSVESFEILKHRDGQEPPLPPDLVRGTPGSVLSPVAVQPVETVQATPSPTPAEQVKGLAGQMLRETGELPPSQSTWAGLSDWSPDRG